jgi:hypothetical protein
LAVDVDTAADLRRLDRATLNALIA